jgi:type II secretory pathway pseudopilin PulG
MKRTRTLRTGIATIVAVALVGIAGAATTALMASIATDARRTRQAAEDAQVRQLLLAGSISVAEKAASWDNARSESRWPLPLPPEMESAADGTKQLSMEIANDPEPERCTVTITATFGRRHGSQEIRLQRIDRRWRIAHITLAP